MSKNYCKGLKFFKNLENSITLIIPFSLNLSVKTYSFIENYRILISHEIYLQLISKHIFTLIDKLQSEY